MKVASNQEQGETNRTKSAKSDPRLYPKAVKSEPPGPSCASPAPGCDAAPHFERLSSLGTHPRSSACCLPFLWCPSKVCVSLTSFFGIKLVLAQAAGSSRMESVCSALMALNGWAPVPTSVHQVCGGGRHPGETHGTSQRKHQGDIH